MSKKPLISSITPCYKMEAYLEKFLEELPNQENFDEIQIVLDHNDPTEKEIQWVHAFQKKHPDRLKHIITSPVEPIGTSMNTCIDQADGELLAIWNVDDLRTPWSLKEQSVLIDDEHGISHGNFIIVNNFGGTTGKFIDHTIYSEREFTRGMVLGPFFMFKKSLVEKAGYFDEQLKSGADFDLAVRLAANTKVAVTEKVLGYYLDEGKGASTSGDGRQPLERTVVELRYGILDKIEQHYLPKAVSNYNIRKIVEHGKLNPVSNYINNYEEFVRNNGPEK